MNDIVTELVDKFFDRLQRAKLAFLFLFGIVGVIAGLYINANCIQQNTILGQDYLAAGLGMAVGATLFHSILWANTLFKAFRKSIKRKKSKEAELIENKDKLTKSFRHFLPEQKKILKSLSNAPQEYNENHERGLYTLYSSGYIVKIQYIETYKYVYDLHPDFKDLVKSLLDEK